MWRTSFSLGAVALLAAAGAAAGAGPAPWAVEEMSRLEGRWLADNSEYEGAGEPYDAYGLEWSFTPGRQGLKGRLFGLQDGREAGTFWEFRLFWQPEEEALRVLQFGTDGTYGDGTVRPTGEQSTEMIQTFHSPDGSSFRSGHREVHQGDRRTSRSFAVEEDGTWTPRRSYVWVRQLEQSAESPSAIGYRGTLLVQLAVADLDRAVEFYTGTLGFRLESRSEELEWARVKPGISGVTVGLGRQDVVGGSGTLSLNLGVFDLDRARATLESRGVRFSGPTVEVPGVVRLADFEDPDGNRIRLAEDVSGSD